jgi:hypothetical protein
MLRISDSSRTLRDVAEGPTTDIQEFRTHQKKNTNRNLVDPSQLGCRQAYRLFKLTVANVASPHVSNAMSGDVLRPFRCDYLRTTLWTLPAKYSAHG